MESFQDLFSSKLSIWTLVPIVFGVWIVGCFILKTIFFHILKRLARKTTTQVDDILLKSANLPLNFIILVSGIAIIQPLIPFAEGSRWPNYFGMGFKVATIIAAILFVDKSCC